MNDFERRAAEGVERTMFPVTKKPLVQAASCAYVIQSIFPADPQATKKTRDLLRFLHEMKTQEGFLFGQQNAAHIGISITSTDGSESDIKKICGSHPAVVGIDTLSFTGYEGTLSQMIQVTKQVTREHGVVTLSMHAPNFALCDEAFHGYSPNVINGNLVPELMQGGQLHAKYLRYLDLVAEYARAITDDKGEYIPILFRPFHENNGSWFWWGAEHCTPAEYKELFRFTVHYLQKEKGIHHFLYAYSPNGPFRDETDYLERYPGDDTIDVIGFDMYHDRPTKMDSCMDILRETCRLVCAIARDHHKVAAVTECGVRMLDMAEDKKEYEGLSPTDNPRPNWFSECCDTICGDSLGREVAFFLTWANFSREQFWTPYLISETRGHEMINTFSQFLSDPRVILASQL